MLKNQLVSICFLAFASVFVFGACSGRSGEESEAVIESENEEQKEQFYANLHLPVELKQNASWPGNRKISASAEVREMQVVFSLKIDDLPKFIIPISADKQDTFLNTRYNLSFACNSQPLKVVMNPEKHRWFYRNGFGTEADSLLDHTTNINKLNRDKYIEVRFPLFALSRFPANKSITIDVHVWQDCFLSEEKQRKEVINQISFNAYYRDTLKVKLIDNVYSFKVTVPEIYKTDIICDSIVLQNDAEWNPAGSDHTLWKSTYPDIYFSIHDLYDNIQGSSTVEKSTAKFTIGDTIPYYHYKERETFYINVYDFDMLSKNDILGWQKTNLSKFKEAQNYCLKFGHVNQFCFRKKYFGKIN
ncbi:MAG: hypothetical protein Q8M29_14335 [Bacteroidota bacterium]|nr:hypothetical protein [Bacteroidota bacterium]